MRRQVASSRGAKAGRPAGATNLVQALARKVLEPFVADSLDRKRVADLAASTGRPNPEMRSGQRPGRPPSARAAPQRVYVSITRVMARSQTRQNAVGLCVNMMQSSSGR